MNPKDPIYKYLLARKDLLEMEQKTIAAELVLIEQLKNLMIMRGDDDFRKH